MARQQGYIKISRAIQDHWVWRNAEHLKWWLDLLFMAAWKDTETLKRGQLRASVRYLQERWARYDENDKAHDKPSKDTVSAYLAELERGTLIRTLKHRKWGTLITIVNYERYQGFTTSEKDTIKDTKTNEVKDKYEEYINNNISTTTTDACVHVREGDFTEELKTNMSWREAMCMRHQLSQAQLSQYIDTFALDCKCNGKERHESLSDAMAHCNGWLITQKRNERDEQRKDNSRPMSADEARAKRMQEYAAMLTTVNPDGTVKHGS
jgi:hypothetical protein